MVPLIFYILFALSMLYLYFGFYVFFKNKNSMQNRMFLSICINLSLWSLGYSFMTVALNPEAANFWRLISAIGWCFFYGTWLDFAILVRLESKKWMTDIRRLLIYIPSVFFLIGNLHYAPKVVMKKLLLIWTDVYPTSYFEILYILYALSFTIAGIVIIYQWGKRSTLNREKKQAHIILLSINISFILAMIIDIIIPLLGINRFHLGILMFVIAMVGIYQALTKYHMMSFSPQAAHEYILETVSDPVILIGTDFLIKKVNSPALKLTGFVTEELLGYPINKLFNESEVIQSELNKLAEMDTVNNIEVGLLTKRLNCIPCLFSCSFINNEFNDTLGIACIIHNITERKNAEIILLDAHRELERKVYERTRELEEMNSLLEEEIQSRIYAEEGLISSEEKFSVLIKQSSDGIIVIDQETKKMIRMNDVACSILDITEGQIYELLDDHFISSNNAELKLAFFDIIEQKTMLIKETIKYTNSKGTSKSLKLSATFVGYNNKPYIMITIRDITEELIMEERARQMAKMDSLGTLSGGIAHDFNNILAGIMGYTQLTLEDLEDNAFLSENLQEVLKLGERAKKLISQILTFSKKTFISPEIVDLSSLIEEVIHMLKATLPANIDLKFLPKGDTFQVYADQGELHQLIMNLCVNAELAMAKQGGTLQVILSKAMIDKDLETGYQVLKCGEYIKLEVVDNGCGIEESVKERIFEPFFTTRGSHGGTGLGLSVVHGIVSRIEGVITVDSEIDKGTTFTVYLPVIVPSLTYNPMTDKIIDRSSARILLVDDEESIVTAVQRLLRRQGYQVTGVLNAHEALTIFKQNTDAFDIVLTDQSMPYMSGDALVKELHLIKPELPVVICSGYNLEPDLKENHNMEFLLKPVPIKEYIRVIEKLLAINNSMTS